MGVNNKQRRAAKQRKRARQRASGGSRGQEWFGTEPEATAYALADLALTSTVRRLSRRKLDDADLLRQAESLLRRVSPTPAYVVEVLLGDLLARLVDTAIGGGWGPVDLAELVRRNADPRHLPLLAAVLHDDARRHRKYAGEWLAAVDAVGPETRLRLDTTATLASGLAVAALVASAPLLDADAVSRLGVPAAGAHEHPKLAKVRALLAKAESTNFEDEAEALTAKAQELISRYALKRLLAHHDDHARGDQPGLRRIWLDAPYLLAKASLVDQVAGANRCRVAVTERLGFCLVVGAPADLDAVELLVTSLLVQADTAMVRQGRRVDRRGASRTRSFRQSFLIAFASRIGERLRAATAAAAADEQDARLLPALRDHEERVTEAFAAMVPHIVQKATSVSNGEGWAAGLAAADLAALDVNGQIPETAS